MHRRTGRPALDDRTPAPRGRTATGASTAAPMTDESGASAVEYAIMLAAIAAVVAVVVIALGPATAQLFQIAWP